jgi:hypothetical protein
VDIILVDIDEEKVLIKCG